MRSFSSSSSHRSANDRIAQCQNKLKVSVSSFTVEGKGKSEHLYSALYGIQTTLKRSGMDHTVLPAINTIPAVYLVSVHQIEVANI